MTTDAEIEAVCRVLAYEEWPYATEQERQDWATAHWFKWARQAKAVIVAVRNLKSEDAALA